MGMMDYRRCPLSCSNLRVINFRVNRKVIGDNWINCTCQVKQESMIIFVDDLGTFGLWPLYNQLFILKFSKSLCLHSLLSSQTINNDYTLTISSGHGEIQWDMTDHLHPYIILTSYMFSVLKKMIHISNFIKLSFPNG